MYRLCIPVGLIQSRPMPTMRSEISQENLRSMGKTSTRVTTIGSFYRPSLGNTAWNTIDVSQHSNRHLGSISSYSRHSVATHCCTTLLTSHTRPQTDAATCFAATFTLPSASPCFPVNSFIASNAMLNPLSALSIAKTSMLLFSPEVGCMYVS